MFIGHYAPAFLAAAISSKKARVPLGLGFIATQLVDIGFFSFTLLGVEHFRIVPNATVMNSMDLYDMPWTHSLLGGLAWALGLAVLLWLWRREWKLAALGALLVLSHWMFDLLVHRPDLTLWGQPPKLGLGLWNHPLIEMPLELVLAFGAMAIYLWRTRPKGVMGWIAPVILAIGLAGLQAINWNEPQPYRVIDPAPAMASWLGLIAYSILTALAFFTDSFRKTRTV